jgi:Ni/Fe-hydrogenase subunit HybB-like protein
VLLPVAILLPARMRTEERGLVVAAFLAVFGFVMNRMNVSVTGMEAAAGVRYLPSWMEVVVSLAIVALGMAAFALAVKYLPIFDHEPRPLPIAAPPAPGHAGPAGAARAAGAAGP